MDWSRDLPAIITLTFLKYGLEPGDIILKIDDTDVMPLAADECSNRMKGQPGTQVKFLVKKGRTGETKEIVITRERIHISDFRKN